MLFVTVGMNCLVKFKTIEQKPNGIFGKKETLGEGIFQWPKELIGNDETKQISWIVELSNAKGILHFTISRFREISEYFRKMYLNQNNF